MMTDSATNLLYPDVLAIEKQFVHLTTGSTVQEEAPVKAVKKKKKKVKGLYSHVHLITFTWCTISQQQQQVRQAISQ